MNDRVRITVSGIRGEVPQALNVELVSKFTSAFASYFGKGRIAFCRDSRQTSPMLAMAIFSAITAAGLDVWDFNLLPTPFLQYLMARKKCAGGIAVTGGHNPLPWNAVLLLNEQGHYLETTEGSEVFNIYESRVFKKASWKTLGRVTPAAFPLNRYLSDLGDLLDLERIRSRGFKIVADPCSGAASPFLKNFADFMNITLIAINDQPSQAFPHAPEPNAANASQAEAVVRATDADLGFLLNSDGSRLSLVDETGRALSEEMTFPLCLLSLNGRIKKAVTTHSTSALSAWAAARAGVTLIKTKVGQSSVVNMMQAEEADAGGEGSGSFVLARFSHGYDALLSLALILDFLAGKKKTLSESVSQFPRFFRKKINIAVPAAKIYKIMDRMEEIYTKEKPDTTDGICITRKDVWFHIRPSMTEFALRVIIEGSKKSSVYKVEEEIRERMEP